ncbi:hypothetical protein NEMBOFW57_002644 [Staphylotrichum longicolle]|uniref:Pyroglutamyl peptidase type I n=1 Tax=Staphylotrichum longicolle TaxID=669026 RepID=A0AAD4HYV8_9PEZI|nr:hypothetical protein NEMBOFW57_002644 [Staphylotrichum longicolle]
MGSVAADRDSSEEPINVLITGFEPFKKDYPVNPSWEIARSLPTHLPPVRVKTTPSSEEPPIPPVRLLVHPTPIRVAYPTVRALVPSLWHLDEDDAPDTPERERRPRIDAVIHIGMAGPRLFYSIERRGHRDGHLDLRISEDAGHYLCDFIYFSSLAHLYKAGVERKVLFLHVPSDASEHSVAIGRELVLQLVRAVVESEMVRRRKAEGETTKSE